MVLCRHTKSDKKKLLTLEKYEALKHELIISVLLQHDFFLALHQVGIHTKNKKELHVTQSIFLFAVCEKKRRIFYKT